MPNSPIEHLRTTAPAATPRPRVHLIGPSTGKAARLARKLGLRVVRGKTIRADDVALMDDFRAFARRETEIAAAVADGAKVVFLELAAGKLSIVGRTIEVRPCADNPRHFVSRRTGHPLVAEFHPNDFRFWCDDAKGYPTPVLYSSLLADGWTAILTCGHSQRVERQPELAAAELNHGQGVFRICQLELANRVATNPVAKTFAHRLLG